MPEMRAVSVSAFAATFDSGALSAIRRANLELFTCNVTRDLAVCPGLIGAESALRAATYDLGATE